MIYREDVIIFAKMYINKRGNNKRGQTSKLSRNELVEKVIQKGAYKRTEKNIKEIRKILNEEFGKGVSDKKIKEDKEKEIITMYIEGKPTKDILKEFKIVNSTLHNVLKRNDIPRRNRGRIKVEYKKVDVDLNDEVVERVNKLIKLENISRGLKG